MSGLRARNKAARDGRIIRSAARLFRSVGYDGTKIETIADEAEVSIGTIYNYYQNKGDILVAIVSMEVNEVLNAGRGVVANPPRNVADAVDTLIGIYVEHSLMYLSKEMWRLAMAIALSQPHSPSGTLYSELDQALRQQVCSLMERLRELELVRADVDTHAVGELIFNNVNMMFIEFVRDEPTTVTSLRTLLRRHNRTLVRAIAGDA